MSGKKKRQRVNEVIDTCGLTEVRGRVIGRLSKGYKQRIGLADSLVHEPELLILDEPTIGLDPNQIRHIRNLIKSLAVHHTVLLSSHILPEVEMICQRVLIINKGRIVASDTPAELMGRMRGGLQVTADVQGPADKVAGVLGRLAGIETVVCEGEGDWRRYRCDCAKESDVRAEIFKAVSANGWVLRELVAEKRNLEDVFIAVTTEEKDL